MATQAELAIVLKAKDDASAVLKKVSGQLGGLDKAGADASKGMGDLAGSIKSVVGVAAGLAAGAAAFTALGGALKGAVDSAAGFEASMSGIKAVAGATGQQMQQLSSLALDLGKSTAFSAQEAAGGIEELVKGGVSIADVMGGAASAALNLAAAGGTSVGEAATIAANAMNQFGLSGANMAHVSDLVAGAANASSISVSDFNQSLAAVGAVANQAGQSIDSTAVAIALMGAQGIKGSDAGTSLKAMLNNLIPTTDAATAKMRELGLITADGSNQFINAQGGMKSFGEIAGVLQTALAGLTDSQKLLAEEILFGSDGMRAAGVLAKQGAAGFDTMAESMGKVTAASVAAERLNNLRGDIEQLKGSLETAGIVIGSAFLPALRSITQTATSVVNTFTDEFQTIATTAQNIAGAHGIGLVPAALTAVEMRLGEVFGSQTQSAFHNVRQAAEDVGAAFEVTAEQARGLADRAGSDLAPALATVRDAAAGAEPVVRALGDSFSAVGEVAAPLTRQFADYLAQQGLVSNETAKLTGLQQQQAAVADALWAIFEATPLGKVVTAFQELSGAIQHAQGVTAEAATATDRAWQAFIAGAGAVRDQVVAKLEEVAAYIRSLPGRFQADAVATGASIVNGIAQGMNPAVVVQKAAGMVIAAINAARAAADSHSPSREFEAIGETFPEGLVVGVEGGTPGVLAAVTGMVETVVAAADAAIGALGDVMGAQFERTFSIVERAQVDLDNKRDQIVRDSQRAQEVAERQHGRRMAELQTELGGAQAKARQGVLEKIQKAQADHAAKIVDIEARMNDQLDELAIDSADKLRDAREKQALAAGTALTGFLDGAKAIARDVQRAAEEIGRKAQQALTDARAAAAEAIDDARTNAANRALELVNDQTLQRGIRTLRDNFSAGQDKDSLDRDRAQENADLEYRLKRDLERAKLDLGKDRAKAETDEERREADVRYAESVADLKQGFEDAKKDLERRRQIEDSNREYRKQQQAALQRFNDQLEDEALGRQVKRLQDERDARIREIEAALDEKTKKILAQEKQERDDLAKSAEQKLSDLREKFFDKIPGLSEEAKGAFEEVFRTIATEVGKAAQSVNDLAAAMARAANVKVSPQSGGATWANQPQSVRDMFTANYGANAQARWEAEHAAEIAAQPQSSGGGGGGSSAPSQTSDVHAAGFDWGAYNAANQGKPRNPDGTVKNAMGGAVRAGWPYTIGEHGPELFVPGADGYVMAHGAASLAASQAGTGGSGEAVCVYLTANIGTVIGDDKRRVAEELAADIQGALGRLTTLKLG